MDYNNHSNPYTQPDPPGGPYLQRPAIRNPGQGLATAAMILGLLSIFTVFTVYVPFVFGSIAITLALLSKGYGKKMLATARIGVGTAIGGIALVLTIVISLLSLLFSNGDMLVDFGKEMDQQFEQQTGQKLKDLLGQSYEDIMRDYADMLDN